MTVVLNHKKLLGFRLVDSAIGAKAGTKRAVDHLGAKAGVKVGAKVITFIGAKAGAKTISFIGAKVGAKAGISREG